MADEYRSIKSASTAVMKVEGSKFIAGAFPVEGQSQAEASLAKVRKEYFDATHHCFAYALGSEGKEFRYSDDGEPSGTGGVKILAAIQSRNLSDILVVVTRYFGGTKLGTGGLGRAYFESAGQALSGAEVIQKLVTEELEMTFPYDETSKVMNALSHLKAKIIDTIYDDDVTLRVSVRKSSEKSLGETLVDATRGNIALKHPPK
ncbi:MAG TPA: YigZ family protein [Bacteroidota bacterium]|nr:YigZ family protein [Bacteroidota bacterium]